MPLESIVQISLGLFLALYILCIPVSARDYPIEPVMVFPDSHVDTWDYIMHTLAYVLACFLALSFLVFLGVCIVLSWIFTFEATAYVLFKAYKMFIQRPVGQI